MRYYLAWLLCSFASIITAVRADSPLAGSRPNVMVILADDLGYADVGCYGGEIQTPNLDSLAQKGLRFTQFYNTARCWPTRGALLTGYYAQAIGRDALPNVPGGARAQRPQWARLLPEMLKAHGYRSYLSGKWHVDGVPIQAGFDHSYVIDDHDRYHNPQKHTRDNRPLPPVEAGSDFYLTTFIADHAIECLQEHAAKYTDQPFFHYVTFTAPHFPLHAKAEDIAGYANRYQVGWDQIRLQRYSRQRSMSLITSPMAELEPAIGPPYAFPKAIEQLGAGEVNRELNWRDLNETQQSFQAAKMAVHAAMIDRMDQEIGRLVSQLQAMNRFEDTLILFLSDNGASAEIMIRGDGHDPQASIGSAASYTCLGPGWSSAANTPFRRHKTWVHEGGIATPLIAHWPKGITSAGQLRSRAGHVIDIVPTVLELAGATWPAGPVDDEQLQGLRGVSFADCLADGPEQARAQPLWWLHEGNRALRDGQWKIVAAKDEDWQLYDLTSDRAETNDQSTIHPERLKTMAEQWNRLTGQMEQLLKNR